MQDYQSMFQKRGGNYHLAMELAPDARNHEFAQVVNHLQSRSGCVVADVPAGGGYLGRYLPVGTTYLPHEPCDTFGLIPGTSGNQPPQGRDLLPLPWASESVDAIVSLAGVHHLESKEALFEECRRVIREDGQLILSDVDEGSAVAHFLDDFVGAHNSTGHEGLYLSHKTRDDLTASGWHIDTDQRASCPWVFRDEQEISAFFRHLFDLRNIEEPEILDGIERHLGINREATLMVPWSLRTLVACPRRSAQ